MATYFFKSRTNKTNATNMALNGTHCAQIRRAFPLRVSYLPTSNNGKHSECLCAFCMVRLAVLTCKHFCAHSVCFVCLKSFVASECAA